MRGAVVGKGWSLLCMIKAGFNDRGRTDEVYVCCLELTILRLNRRIAVHLLLPISGS